MKDRKPFYDLPKPQRQVIMHRMDIAWNEALGALGAANGLAHRIRQERMAMAREGVLPRADWIHRHATSLQADAKAALVATRKALNLLTDAFPQVVGADSEKPVAPSPEANAGHSDVNNDECGETPPA